MYEIKKVGRHWLIRRHDGQFKRLRLPADAETIELTDNFLIVDDIVYEIKSKGDDVYVELVPDISVGEECLSDEKDLNIVHEVENIRLETTNNSKEQSNSKINIEIEKNDDLLERQNHLALETGATRMFPVTLIDETENNKSKLACSENVPKQYEVNQVMDYESFSESKDTHNKILEERLNKTQTECYEKQSLVTPLQISTEQNNCENTSEMDLGHIQDDLLETGQTEETSKIEIVNGINKDTVILTPHVVPAHSCFDQTESTRESGSKSSVQFPVTDEIHEKRNDLNCDYDIVDVIEKVPKDIIIILRERYKSKFHEIIGDAKMDISFSQDSIIISAKYAMGCEKDIRKVRNYVESFLSMNVERLPVDDKLQNKIQSVCSKIEDKVGYDCCTFIVSENVVLVHCKSYDDNLKVRHLLKLVTGEIKPTLDRTRKKRDVFPESSVSKETQNRKYGKCHESAPEIYDWNNKTKHLKLFKMPNNIIIRVYQADILGVPVDCIVNASNGRLQHGGGVALAIARAAGEALVSEGNFFVKKYGAVQSGSVCATTAGKLPYICVIHAIGPGWQDYYPHTDSNIKMCEDALYSAIFNALHKAEEKGCKSVAIPSVSAAIFGVPKQLCVCMYVQATIQYCANAGESSLAEIHFVDLNTEMVQLIQNEFQTVVGDNKKSKYNRSDYVRQQRGRKGRNLQRETQ